MFSGDVLEKYPEKWHKGNFLSSLLSYYLYGGRADFENILIIDGLIFLYSYLKFLLPPKNLWNMWCILSWPDPYLFSLNINFCTSPLVLSILSKLDYPPFLK